MMRYEYRHVRMAYRVASFFSKGAFDRQLSGVLQELGNAGWELKAAIHEGLFAAHVHLIFSRQAEAV